MGLKSTLGNAVGYALLAVACGAGIVAVYGVTLSLLYGVTMGTFALVFFALGMMVTAGFVGYFVRKAVAGQVMPSSFDTSVAYRGGR